MGNNSPHLYNFNIFNLSIPVMTSLLARSCTKPEPFSPTQWPLHSHRCPALPGLPLQLMRQGVCCQAEIREDHHTALGIKQNHPEVLVSTSKLADRSIQENCHMRCSPKQNHSWSIFPTCGFHFRRRSSIPNLLFVQVAC